MKQTTKGRSGLYIGTFTNKEFNSPRMKKVREFAKKLGRPLSINGRHSDRRSLLKLMGKEDYNYVSGIYVKPNLAERVDIYCRTKYWTRMDGIEFSFNDTKVGRDTKKLREFSKTLFKIK